MGIPDPKKFCCSLGIIANPSINSGMGFFSFKSLPVSTERNVLGFKHCK